MTDETSFPVIDTSYWKIKNPEWMAQRKNDWPRIEAMLKGPKSGKGKTAIKQYFMMGKMPDWDKFRDWNSYERHLDLFMFIWLHPSWDEAVLKPLRDAYMASNVIVLDDLNAGFGIFHRWSINMACQDYSYADNEELGHCLHTDGHNELLFNILMGDLERTCYELEFKNTFLVSEKAVFHLPKGSLSQICTMSAWLCVEMMYPINADMLFQYDQPLEWWYRGCETNEDFFKKSKNRGSQAFYQKALYRIHHFDTEKEGDTCRTRFVHKISKILDEREFIPEFKQMWEDVKADKIEVKDPWKR